MLAVAYCMQRNIPEYVVAEMKLGVCSRGRFANRLMFPVFDSGGRLIFYQGRAMSKPRAYERFIKTLSPRSDTTVEAGPADCLLNLQYLIDHAKTERVLLVEGPVDVAHAWPDAVGLFGKRISGRQIELLMRAGVKELDLGLDPDAAADALKVAPMLADLFTLRVVRWPLGSDPGSLTKDAIEDYRAQAVLWGTGDRLLKLTDTIR
jgi:DNA primase